MKSQGYSSPICEYCKCTDWGFQTVNTGPWNMCEGIGCEDAFEEYKVSNPEDDRKLEDMF